MQESPTAKGEREKLLGERAAELSIKGLCGDYAMLHILCTISAENALNFPLIPFSGKPNNLAKKYMTLRFLGENF